MAKGGARSRSGPPPDMLALTRKRDGKDWTILPATPIDEADIPEWPDTMPDHDPGEPGQDAQLLFSSDEARMWHRLWQLPQARVWLADHMIDTVAAYVRTYLEAFAPGGPVGKGTLARQLSESLLLTTPALHAARYLIKNEIEGSENWAEANAAARKAPRASAATGVRSRLGSNVIPITTQAADADDEPWDEGPPRHPDEE